MPNKRTTTVTKKNMVVASTSGMMTAVYEDGRLVSLAIAADFGRDPLTIDVTPTQAVVHRGARTPNVRVFGQFDHPVDLAREIGAHIATAFGVNPDDLEKRT